MRGCGIARRVLELSARQERKGAGGCTLAATHYRKQPGERPRVPAIEGLAPERRVSKYPLIEVSRRKGIRREP